MFTGAGSVFLAVRLSTSMPQTGSRATLGSFSDKFCGLGLRASCTSLSCPSEFCELVGFILERSFTLPSGATRYVALVMLARLAPHLAQAGVADSRSNVFLQPAQQK